MHHYAEVAEISTASASPGATSTPSTWDEFLDWQGRPIPVDHPLSFEGFMKRSYSKLDELRIPEEQTHYPHPFRIDEISEQIREVVGGIDVCYGGVGYHGHVAFNEPPLRRWHEISIEELRQSLTRVVSLATTPSSSNPSTTPAATPKPSHPWPSPWG
ncbi:MAG: hypothetical protein R2724_20275 [Bryobacterales bacterium]